MDTLLKFSSERLELVPKPQLPCLYLLSALLNVWDLSKFSTLFIYISGVRSVVIFREYCVQCNGSNSVFLHVALLRNSCFRYYNPLISQAPVPATIHSFFMQPLYIRGPAVSIVLMSGRWHCRQGT